MDIFEQQLKDNLSNAYDIERELGGGGMSRVFVATDRSLGRKVVIKLLSPELIADVNRGRFRREIQVAAQLQHPHIVTLLSAGEHGDLVYYTMPFISGESLKSAVEKHGPLSVVDTVRVLYHVSEALDYAHGEGVVHRDIKPANILRSGTYALVTDFGVAKALNAAMPSSGGMTATGMAIGTPAYMAPEQLAGDPQADHRIDIYAVGLLAYELLKGTSPFAATTPQRVLAAVLTQDPQPLIELRPDVPRSLSDLVMKCLSKDPEDRPANARALLGGLDMFSTASGEIRTMEHKIPRNLRTAPTGVAAVADRADTDSVRTPTPVDQVQAVEPDSPKPKGKSKKMLVGGLALLLPVAAGAIFLSQRAGGGSSGPPAAPPTAPSAAAAPTTAAAVVNPAPVQPPPVAVPEKPVVATAAVDSQAIKVKDSVKRAVRAESLKRAAAAAAKADTVKRMRDAGRIRARSAVTALLADVNANKAFLRGATSMGGPLGKRRKGDLQTQIDALLPFLTKAGLTYDQFKGIVAESGARIFDEFGRMVPDSLQRFAAGAN